MDNTEYIIHYYIYYIYVLMRGNEVILVTCIKYVNESANGESKFRFNPQRRYSVGTRGEKTLSINSNIISNIIIICYIIS